MNAHPIEHRGVVRSVEGGQAIVALVTGSCPSCGQGNNCDSGQMDDRGTSPLLAFEVGDGFNAGDQVGVVLRESCLTVSALFGYLFPAVAMLLGAWAGATRDGSDGATALGAIGGFLAALLVVRIASRFVPGLLPSSRLTLVPNHSHVSQQEFHHDR